MPNGYESIDNEHPQVDDFGENYYSSSRTIDSLAEGEFWHDNGRFDIWRLSLLAIKENPVFGQGFFGDRLYVGEELLWGYSHNVFLEVLSHFGIFGVLLLATLLFVTFKLIASNGNCYLNWFCHYYCNVRQIVDFRLICSLHSFLDVPCDGIFRF